MQSATMSTDIEQISIAFHNRAREVFFSLYRDFKNSISSVDRKHDENSFRQLREKYVNALQQELESFARETVDRYKTTKGIDQLNQNLRHFIADYTNQFVQKIRSL
jgi:hypothetical protein